MIINVRDWADDVVVPESAGGVYAGRSLNEINALALQGVRAAHSKAGIPIIQIDEYSAGLEPLYPLERATLSAW